MAFVKDLGKIKSTKESTVFTIGLARDPATVFSPPNSTEDLPEFTRFAFYTTRYEFAADGVSFISLLKCNPQTYTSQLADFLGDFDKARSRADSLDQKILASAYAISSNLADLVSLATRIVLGSMDMTYGGYNHSDIMIFVDSMGSMEHDPIGPGR